MTLDEILLQWTKDSEIDKTELGDESLRTISLHSKWLGIYKKEKLKLLQMKTEYNKLHLKKHEFYQDGPTLETQELGWQLPARGQIIKSDVPMYIDADQDIINVKLKIGLQQEKVDALKDIIVEINNRRWSIRAAIDWNKWISGG